jgi:hypothetical protein
LSDIGLGGTRAEVLLPAIAAERRPLAISHGNGIRGLVAGSIGSGGDQDDPPGA